MDSCLDAGGAEEGLQVEVVAEVSGRAAEDLDLVVLEDSTEVWLS